MGLTVGIAADNRFLKHKTGHFHPEHPKRLDAVYRMLEKDFPDILIRIKPEPATLEQVERVHTPGYINRLLKTADQKMTSLAPDTPISADTYMAAWLAAGACIQGVDRLMSKECDAFFALIRPPGHHALPDRAAGFCIFNNIGIAATYALDQYRLKRILVLDWDIHHGNGIHDLFYDTPKVLYLSTHDLMLYPYSGEIKQTGSGAGAGYTVNIPIPRDLTDDGMVFLYTKILTPLVRSYRPELIMVAAGFDAHTDDPIGRSRLTEAAYAGITRLLMHLREAPPHPPLFFSLEGGYHQRALTKSIQAVLTELTGDTPYAPPDTPPEQAVADLVSSIFEIHSSFGVFK